jgi:phospholipase C
MAILDLIDTIVVVVMENRSFDHMLGYLSHPDFGKRPDVNGQKADQNWRDRFTNECNGRRQAPFHATRLDVSDDPRHERENFRLQFGADFKPGVPYPMNGFMKNYAQDPGLSPDELTQVMGFFTPAEIPITAFLAENYAICDNWFASIPTSTQPNRLMAMGGYTKTDNTFSSTVPDQDLVYDWCGRQNKRPVRWRVYHEGWPFFMVMNRWRLEILDDAVAGRGQFSSLSSLGDDFKHDQNFPEVVFVEPKYTSDHFSPPVPSDDHSPTTVSGGQAFLRRVYSALTANPARWQRTVMIVTYDEAGGFFDHVSPPELKTAVVESGSAPFMTMGVRVPGMIVSPLIKPRSLFKGLLDHTSILKFIGQKFGDNGYYSGAVNNRPLVGSVLDVLNDPACRVDAPRADVPQPPPYTPTDSFVRGRNYHPVTPSAEAFAYALKRMREDDHERDRAATKFPELTEFLSAHENLLWELAKAIVKAKGCVLGDCARNLEIFLEDQEKKLDQDESLAAVAYANLTEMINKMVAEARAGGSFVISDANFLASRPNSLFDRG